MKTLRIAFAVVLLGAVLAASSPARATTPMCTGLNQSSARAGQDSVKATGTDFDGSTSHVLVGGVEATIQYGDTMSVEFVPAANTPNGLQSVTVDGASCGTLNITGGAASGSADLFMVKTLVTFNPPIVGTIMPFSLDVTNEGPGDATHVVVTDVLPVGMEIIESEIYVPDGWVVTYDESTRTLRCEREGTLGAHKGSQACGYKVLLTRSGTLQNAATATADQPDPDLRNNRSVKSLTVSGAPCDLWVLDANETITESEPDQEICVASSGNTINLLGDNNLIVMNPFGGNTIGSGGGTGNTLSYAPSNVGINADLTAGTVTFGTLTDSIAPDAIQNLIGTRKADHLTGDEQNNQLFGQGANDVLHGGGGSNLLNGGPGTKDKCFKDTGTATYRGCEVKR